MTDRIDKIINSVLEETEFIVPQCSENCEAYAEAYPEIPKEKLKGLKLDLVLILAEIERDGV